MAHRSIGPTSPVPDRLSRSASLDELLAVISWEPIAAALAGIYAAPKGEKAWPPLALFRALLLAVWYDLSDERLAEALDDRRSFRRFCGFADEEPTPERTAFVRFRRELVARGLDRRLFDIVADELERRRLIVRHGTLIDATVIGSASLADEEAKWVGHRRRKPVHGYKAHVATDADSDLVCAVEVTSANVHDGSMLKVVLPEHPGDTYGDTAYASGNNEQLVHARGGQAYFIHQSIWGSGPEAGEYLARRNAEIHRIRARIEKTFGTWKRSYGLRRVRSLGLARASLQVRLTAIAFNLKHAWRLLTPAHA